MDKIIEKARKPNGLRTTRRTIRSYRALQPSGLICVRDPRVAFREQNLNLARDRIAAMS